ncbi:MAG: STAS domain-containing protein [Betaproteobacteria bacterium]|nr:STAS domain-containing protein [Betaproteobacteria bacterium]
MFTLEDRSTADACVLALAGEMTIYESGQLWPAVKPFAGSQGDLRVDLTAVGEIDSAGIQVLLMIRGEQQRGGGTFLVTGWSEPVREVVDAMNLGATLGSAGTADATPLL